MALISAYDSRARHLTGGMARGSLGRGRLGFDPNKSYLTGLRFDPTKSYLTGCNCGGKCGSGMGAVRRSLHGMGDDSSNSYDYSDIAAGTLTETPTPSVDQTADIYPLTPAPTIGPALPVESVNWASILGTPSVSPPAGSVTSGGSTVATISPSGTVQPAAGYTVNASGQIVPNSWLSESTLVSGYTNGTVAIGVVGLVAVLSLLKKKKR